MNFQTARARTRANAIQASSPVFFAAPGTPSSDPALAGALSLDNARGLARRIRRNLVNGRLTRRAGGVLPKSPVPCFRAGVRNSGSGHPSGRLPPPSLPAASSHRRQPTVVSADGWPGPPGRGVTSPARGRRAARPFGPARTAPVAVLRHHPHPACSIIETSRDDALSRARRHGIWS